jgi:lincosamide nucleotidyltransferase A/C/D/E
MTGRGREPRADMDARRLVGLMEHLASLGIPVWLDGGWAIDALLGHQRRPHDDLDLVAALDDVARISAALAGYDYVLANCGDPRVVVMVDEAGHQVDVHPVVFTEKGDGIYKMTTGGDWIYPSHGFAGAGEVLGRSVPCLTPEVMMVCHATGYVLDDVHKGDVVALRNRFGIPIPKWDPVEDAGG